MTTTEMANTRASSRPSKDDIEARWEANRTLVWRSVLSVPVNVPRFVAGAHRFGPDAVMLDLEDSVPKQEKKSARAAVDTAAREISARGIDVIVRVNNDSCVSEDVAAAVAPTVRAILIPKVEDADLVREIDRMILARERDTALREGHTALFISIESSFGAAAMDAILGASDRIVAAEIGEEDLAAELAIEPTETGKEFWTIRQLLVLAARRAGIQANGVSGFSDYSNLDNFRERAVEAREVGFSGGSAIHPTQVPVLNEVFSPAAQAVTDARDLVEAWVNAKGQAFGWRGRMVDEPIAQRAYALLRRWEAVQTRDSAKTGSVEMDSDKTRSPTGNLSGG